LAQENHPKVDLAYPPAKGTAPDGDARRRGRRPALVTGLQEDGVAAKDPGQDPIGDENPMRDVRLSELDARLKAAAGAEKARTGAAPAKPRTGYKQGSRVLTELIAGPAGGALIGWFLDRLFGTSPWLLLVLLFLGFAVAIRNIYRISQQRPE